MNDNATARRMASGWDGEWGTGTGRTARTGPRATVGALCLRSRSPWVILSFPIPHSTFPIGTNGFQSVAPDDLSHGLHRSARVRHRAAAAADFCPPVLARRVRRDDRPVDVEFLGHAILVCAP